MPATLSLLISVFTDARERATAIGIWAATAGLGVALGPVVGGFLLDHFWWGSIFIVNVPLTAIALVAGPRLHPRVARPGRAADRLDGRGALRRRPRRPRLGVIEAPSQGWTSAPVLAAGALAAVALAAFVVLAAPRRGAAARRPPLREPALHAPPAARIMVLFFALFGFLFLSTQYLQFVLGYSPSAAGVRVLPYARRDDRVRAALREARRAPRHQARRHRRDAALRGGARRRGDGHARAPATGGSPSRCSSWAPGMGLAGAPATESIMGSLPPERANIGSAVNDTTRELGGALGVAVVGSIMSSLYSTELAARRRPPRATPSSTRWRRVDRRRTRRRGRRPRRVALPPGPRKPRGRRRCVAEDDSGLAANRL